MRKKMAGQSTDDTDEHRKRKASWISPLCPSLTSVDNQVFSPRFVAGIFLFTLVLSFLACMQIDDDFKAVNKVFSVNKQKKAEIPLLLDKAESFQIQIAHRMEGKESVTAELSLFINEKKAKDLRIRGIGTKKTKFAIPRSFFAKGNNLIAWKLTPSQPGVFIDEIKLTNYVGINPNIPVAWIIPDEFIDHSSSQTRGISPFITVFFLIFLTLILNVALCRLIFYNTLNECLSSCRRFLIIPVLALCATLLYSFFTPQKILFPTETALWLTGLSLLAIQLPSALVTGALNRSSSINDTGVTLTIIFLISILAYIPYFKNAWYVQDDYVSIQAGLNSAWYSAKHQMPIESGRFTSILETTKNIINWLYVEQGRYQPVRLFIFMAGMHLYQEELSPYYNFALHLANLVLLFLLLRKFRAEPVAILISTLLFSLFGRWRMMESPSAMIAGSGLNFFLIALTLLFLIKALESDKVPAKKTFFFSVSWFAYFCLVFSYEVAFPLILPIIYVFFVFNKRLETARISGKSPSWLDLSRLTNLLKQRELLQLAPYFLLLSVYIIFFKLPAKGAYPGTTISWNFADIWTRLMNYVDHTVSLRINLNHMGAPEIIILFLYLAVAAFTVRSGKHSLVKSEQIPNNWKTFLFGLTLYFSSVVLFTLNSWESPKNIMVHHLYLMTIGSSIMVVILFFQAHWFLPGATFLIKSNSKRAFITLFLQKHYRGFLIFVYFPLVLVSEGSYTSRYYTHHDVGTAQIKPIKTGILKQVDPNGTDAIIIKNFHHNYHGVSSVEGALLQWFNFKKIITAGRPILSVDDDKIVFMRPLGYYWLPPHMKQEVKNQRAQILFLDNQTLLPYQDLIDFEEGTNLYQTQQVWGDQEPDEYRHYRLDAILRNTQRGGFLEIKAKSRNALESLIANSARIEVNGKPIQRILTSGSSLYIDISPAKNSVNYFFLTLVSGDKNFKKHLQLIRLHNAEKDSVTKDMENIPIGADSWGIG